MSMQGKREIVSTKEYGALQLGSPWSWYKFMGICKVVCKYIRDHLKLNMQLSGDKYLAPRGFTWAPGRTWWEAVVRTLAPCPTIVQGDRRTNAERILAIIVMKMGIQVLLTSV